MARTPARGTWGRLLGLAGALALSVATAIPALAGTVTQVINCGSTNSLSARIADLSLSAMNVSTAAQESPGTLTLTATETGCGGQGWNVTIQAATWTRQGGGATIPASALSLTQVANPAPVSGQGVDTIGGPKLVNELGTLDHSRKVLQANQGYGLGSYTQVLGVKLTIPAVIPSGAYQTVVTTTITAGP